MNVKQRIGIWGDSVLKGVVFDEVKGTYRILAKGCVQMVEQAFGIKILNRTRFGSTVDKGYQQLNKAVESGLDCDIILLEYGGNDCDFDWGAVSANPTADHQPRTPMPLFLETLQQMVKTLRDHSIEPALMSLPPIDGYRYLDYLVSKGADRKQLLSFLGSAQQIYQYHEWYSISVTHLAERLKCLYIPVREAFLARGRCNELICLDGIHPNEKGHQLLQEVFTSYQIKNHLLEPI